MTGNSALRAAGVEPDSALTKRDIKKLDKQARIARAARSLFREQGFAETTTRQIAARAGVANGTIFLYAKCKEDLLTLAFSQEFGEMAFAAFEAVDPAQPFVEQIGDFFQGFYDFHGTDVSLTRELIREVGFLRDPSHDYGISQVPILGLLTKIIERGIERGELDNRIDRLQAAHGLMALYWWCLREWINEGSSREESIALLHRLIDLLISGIGRR